MARSRSSSASSRQPETARAILPPAPSATSSSRVSAPGQVGVGRGVGGSRHDGAAQGERVRRGEGAAQRGRGPRPGAADRVQRRLGVAAEQRVRRGRDGREVGVGQERIEPRLDLVAPAAGQGCQRHSIRGAERVGRGLRGGGSRSRGIPELDGARRQCAERQRRRGEPAETARKDSTEAARVSLRTAPRTPASRCAPPASDGALLAERFEPRHHAGVIARSPRTRAPAGALRRWSLRPARWPAVRLPAQWSPGVRPGARAPAAPPRGEGPAPGRVGDLDLGKFAAAGRGAPPSLVASSGSPAASASQSAARARGSPGRTRWACSTRFFAPSSSERTRRAISAPSAPRGTWLRGVALARGLLRVEHLERAAENEPSRVIRPRTCRCASGDEGASPSASSATARAVASSPLMAKSSDTTRSARARAGARVRLGLGLGAEPLGAGHPGVALLLAEQERARVLLALEGDRRRHPRGQRRGAGRRRREPGDLDGRAPGRSWGDGGGSERARRRRARSPALPGSRLDACSSASTWTGFEPEMSPARTKSPALPGSPYPAPAPRRRRGPAASSARRRSRTRAGWPRLPARSP